MADIPRVPLNPQGSIPLLGFGTWQLTEEKCRTAVEMALECGYRHIDTADAYGNHQQVGEALQASGIPRQEIFLTTKVWRDNLRYEDVLKSGERALKELKVPYLDLLLQHWPNNDIPLEETLRGLKKLVDDGVTRAIGVSNFTSGRLRKALDMGIAPVANNQVEFHPLLNQKDLHQFCKENGVVLTAYSPLAQGKVMENEVMQSVAKKYGKTPTQVAIRWLLQKEIVTIPKATSREHIRSNFEVFDFQLSPEDFQAVDHINAWERLIAWDVAEFDR